MAVPSNEPHAKCRGSPREASKEIRIKAKWASPSPRGMLVYVRKSTISYHSRVLKSSWKNLACVLRSTEVYRTKTDACFLYLQKSKGRRLNEAAHATEVGERRCYTSCGLSRHHKGDLARAVLKGPHRRRLRARASQQHAMVRGVPQKVSHRVEVLVGVLRNPSNAPQKS